MQEQAKKRVRRLTLKKAISLPCGTLWKAEPQLPQKYCQIAPPGSKSASDWSSSDFFSANEQCLLTLVIGLPLVVSLSVYVESSL